MQSIVWLDVVIVIIFLLSAAIGLFRGFVREVISIASWIAAIWLAIVFSQSLAQHLPIGMDQTSFTVFGTAIDVENLRVGLAFLLIALGVLIAGAILNYLMGLVMKAQILKGANRLLGSLFGLLRAAVIVVLLVMVAYLTSMPTTQTWHNSRLLPAFETAATRLVEMLPDKYARYFSVRDADNLSKS